MMSRAGAARRRALAAPLLLSGAAVRRRGRLPQHQARSASRRCLPHLIPEMMTLLCLGTAVLTLAVRTEGGSPPGPPAPRGWTHFPGHCMGNPNCKGPHCSCADGHLGGCPGPDGGECHGTFSEALKHCQATKGCESFALNGGSYEMFALNNWSAVPNTDW